MTRVHPQPGTWRARSLALLLLLCYLLPFAQMAYAGSGDPEAGLPACCRTHGKHKCFMRLSAHADEAATGQAALSSAQITEKCPCIPASPSASDTSPFGLPPSGSVRYVARSESFSFTHWSSPRAHRRTLAHQKRGPPAVRFFA